MHVRIDEIYLIYFSLIRSYSSNRFNQFRKVYRVKRQLNLKLTMHSFSATSLYPKLIELCLDLKKQCKYKFNFENFCRYCNCVVGRWRILREKQQIIIFNTQYYMNIDTACFTSFIPQKTQGLGSIIVSP